MSGLPASPRLPVWIVIFLMSGSLMNTASAQQTSASANGVSPALLLQVPVTSLHPGDVDIRPDIKAPNHGDPAAAQRGMDDFNHFNCIGCHAPNGGGGMGPSLSNKTFIYGSKPENLFMTIQQGRPSGMPSFGSVLPGEVIWDLVAYIQNLSADPSTEWGTTVSPSTPKIEQTPAGRMTTDTPWLYTQPFSKGQKP